MDAWVFWVILAVILAAGEVASLSFFLAPFAVGAIAAALLDAAGVGAVGQFAAFLASSLLLLAIVRPDRAAPREHAAAAADRHRRARR